MTDRLKEGQHSIHSDPMLGTLAEGAAAVRAVRDRERMQCYEQDRNNDRERERERLAELTSDCVVPNTSIKATQMFPFNALYQIKPIANFHLQSLGRSPLTKLYIFIFYG